MYLIYKNDIPMGSASGNVHVDGAMLAIPVELAGLPVEQLRILDGQVVDAAKYAKFYIDTEGRKRLVQVDASWPELACNYSDALIQDGAAWRLRKPSDDLSDAKASAKSSIDSQAESQRQLVLTPGAGQAMTYMLKFDEAQSFLAASNAVASNAAFPMLAAEVGITADSLKVVAQAVMSANTSWRAFGAAIEKTRLSAKKQVSAATDSAAVQSILSNLTWPSAG